MGLRRPKYHDAILYCAGLASKALPPKYKPKMEIYLDILKKEKAKGRGSGASLKRRKQMLFPLSSTKRSAAGQ